MQFKKDIEQLSNLCMAAGLIMKSNEQSFKPIKLAFHPYKMKKQRYDMIGEIHKVWQKLVFLASKDENLIKRTFSGVVAVDPMISSFYNIYLKSLSRPQKDSLMLSRVDFFKNSEQEFKIIEYNLTSVSMASHSQNYSHTKKLLGRQVRNDDVKFPDNTPASDIAQAVSEMYKIKQFNGLFLIVVSSKQRNIVDQSFIQLKLMEKGITSIRASLFQMSGKIQVNQGELFYQGQKVSMVYYRAGYQPSDYSQNGNLNQCWSVRETIQLSNAIKIPDIKMELMNQKRMQVQLSKPQIHQNFLSAQECSILKKSLVFTGDFEQNPQSIDYLNYMQQKGIGNFILKPNLQGGGNNIYGQTVYNMLKSLSSQQKKKYILMQKIITQPMDNILFQGSEIENKKCIAQVSRYGILMELNAKLKHNYCDGYLVRVKPQNQNQGGVMAGVGALATIILEG